MTAISFISQIDNSGEAEVVVEAIIAMAHRLVTFEQASLLVHAGCEWVQSYFYSKPNSGAAMAALVAVQGNQQPPEPNR